MNIGAVAGWTGALPGRLGPRGWWVFAVAWPLAIGLMMPLADGFRLGGDEGHELLKAACWARDGRLPVGSWNDQPLTHTRLYAALLGLDYSPLGPRLWSLFCFAVLLAAVGHAAQVTFRRPAAGLGAAWVVGVSPTTALLAASAMQEVPATAFGVLSFALVLARKGRVPWWQLMGAAAAGAVGVSIKLTAGLYVFCAGAVLAAGGLAPEGAGAGHARQADGRAGMGVLLWDFGRALIYLGLVAGLGGLLLTVVDGRPVERLVGSHLGAFAAANAKVGPVGDGRWKYLAQEYPQMAVFVAAAGLLLARPVWLARRRRLSGVTTEVPGSGKGPLEEPGWVRAENGEAALQVPGWRWWFIAVALPAGVTVANAWIVPWWTYYGLSIWVGFSGLAGFALAWAWDQVRGAFAAGWRLFGGRSFSLWAALALALGGAQVGVESIGQVWLWRRAERTQASPLLAAMREFARGKAAPSMYADEPMFAFWARLPVPSPLVVVTQKRYLSGHLQEGDVPRIVRAADCDFLVLRRGGQELREPDWNRLLDEHYVLVAVSDSFELHVNRRLDPHPYESRMRW